MTDTPNTPKELVDMNDPAPFDPYRRPAVLAAMHCLQPSEANLGDLQAVAEICIEILKDCAKDHAESSDNTEFACCARACHTNLVAAEALMERVKYIQMNNPLRDEEEERRFGTSTMSSLCARSSTATAMSLGVLSPNHLAAAGRTSAITSEMLCSMAALAKKRLRSFAPATGTHTRSG